MLLSGEPNLRYHYECPLGNWFNWVINSEGLEDDSFYNRYNSQTLATRWKEACLELSVEGHTYGWKILQVTREGFQQDEAVTRAGGFGGIFNGLQRAPSASCTALHPGRWLPLTVLLFLSIRHLNPCALTWHLVSWLEGFTLSPCLQAVVHFRLLASHLHLLKPIYCLGSEVSESSLAQ